MKKLTDLEFLRLSKGQKLLYRIKALLCSIPHKLLSLLIAVGTFFKKTAVSVRDEIKNMIFIFTDGDWKTKVSYAVMGFGCIARGQIVRGLLFLLFEAVFIFYMITSGGYWLGKLPTLGTQGREEVVTKKLGRSITSYIYHDNSFKILLYGILTLFFIIALIYTWRLSIRKNREAEMLERKGKKLKKAGDDLRSLVDDQFHKTLLALPLTGIILFTVLPIVFMILVAFTNYDAGHDGLNVLWQWVGLENFGAVLGWSSGPLDYSATFGEITVWTLIWAFFATFTNYFLGMLVAMAINKKGIAFKKGWRTILVLTIAIPQFISLLYVSKMFARNGLINITLMDLGIIDQAHLLPFWEDPVWARITVIIINIWIGIPYLMLITTGILMNIPADLYESARIDGASPWQQYTRITLPYMLFVTGPYLLTSFTGNMNNFNVIYLLTGGAPNISGANATVGNAGHTDLLITWLFKLAMSDSKYYLASVIGILVFIIIAVLSLIVFNLLPSNKNEEDFQ